jgi:hypothetical protein
MVIKGDFIQLFDLVGTIIHYDDRLLEPYVDFSLVAAWSFRRSPSLFVFDRPGTEIHFKKLSVNMMGVSCGNVVLRFVADKVLDDFLLRCIADFWKVTVGLTVRDEAGCEQISVDFEFDPISERVQWVGREVIPDPSTGRPPSRETFFHPS